MSYLSPTAFDTIKKISGQLIYFFHQPIGDIKKLTPKELMALGKGLLEMEEEVGLIKSMLIPGALVNSSTEKHTIDLTKKGALDQMQSRFGRPQSPAPQKG